MINQALDFIQGGAMMHADYSKYVNEKNPRATLEKLMSVSRESRDFANAQFSRFIDTIKNIDDMEYVIAMQSMFNKSIKLIS